LAQCRYSEAAIRGVSNATDSEWIHETLYLSARGRWYIVRTCDWRNARPTVRFIDALEAARWLLVNDHELPKVISSLQGIAIE
jgi:hypothetical protein